MQEDKSQYGEESLDFNVQEKIHQFLGELRDDNLDAAATTTDVILAQLFTAYQILLFVRMLGIVASKEKREQWPDILIEKLNQRLGKLNAEVRYYAQIAEILGVTYEVDYGEFWQPAANQEPFHDIPYSLEFGGNTGLIIFQQWLANTKKYLDKNAEILPPEESSEITRTVVDEVLSELAPKIYPDIVLTKDMIEEEQEKLDDAYLALGEKSQLIKDINVVIGKVKSKLKNSELLKQLPAKEQGRRNTSPTIGEISQEIATYSTDLQNVVANLDRYSDEELSQIFAELEREKEYLVSLQDLGVTELSKQIEGGVKKNPLLVAVEERGVEALREQYPDVSDQFNDDDLGFLAQLLTESGFEFLPTESIYPLIAHAVTLTDHAYSDNYVRGMLRGSAFAEGFSHMATLVKLGEYMRKAMKSLQKRMPLPNMTTPFYVRLPASDNFLILFDEDSLNTVNPDIFSYTSRELGRSDSNKSAVLADLISNTFGEGNQMAIAQLNREGKLIIMEPKRGGDQTPSKAKAKLRTVKSELIDIPQMIDKGLLQYG